MDAPSTVDRTGLIAALGCFIFWGIFPLLFDAMAKAGASAWEIVAWRTVWSIPFAAALVALSGRTAALGKILRQPRAVLTLMASAALIGINWSVYVWAVSHGRTLAASLGYYINPLVSLALGWVLFGERVTGVGWVGVALASLGVLVQALALHALPWIPLTLAFSFAGYGAVRKRAMADAQTGLLVECAVLGAPALLFVSTLAVQGHGSFGRGLEVSLLLMLAGPATVAPLAAFAFAARRLPLSVVGFLQFVSPTLQFACGVILGERPSPTTLLAFLFIWAGVLVFAWSAIRAAAAPASASEAGI